MDNIKLIQHWIKNRYPSLALRMTSCGRHFVALISYFFIFACRVVRAMPSLFAA